MMSNLWDRLPAMPTLTKEAEIPVYVIHKGRGAEDYFFLFDFEVFMERSKAGLFVRPKLRIFAGRDDFDRRLFARQFRQTFAHEFDRMRSAVQDEKNRGWLSWMPQKYMVGDLVVDLVTTLLLTLALGFGKALSALTPPMPKFLKGRAPEAKVETEVETMQTRVETALQNIEVTLHPELYRYAWRGQSPGPFKGMSYDAWPLPASVSEHLQSAPPPTGASWSWW